MKVDIEKLGELEKRADEILFKPEGEKILYELLKIEAQFEVVKQNIKKKIEKSAIKLNPNFKSIRGDKVKVSYRFFGSRYYIEGGMEDKVPKELVEIKKKYFLKIKELEVWSSEKGGLPQGVKEAERSKQISINLIEKDEQ